MQRARTNLFALLCAALFASACDGSNPIESTGLTAQLAEDQCTSTDTCNEPTPAPPPPYTGPSTPVATYAYGSTGQSSYLYPYKYIDTWSTSEAKTNVASASVTATYTGWGNCQDAYRVELGSKSTTSYGSPSTARVHYFVNYVPQNYYRLRAVATHKFVPSTGATGGGTFSSSWMSTCS